MLHNKKIISLCIASSLFISSSLYATQKKQVPFLIQDRLPHLTKMIHMLWDDEDLALTKKQKEKLLVIKQETLSRLKELKQKITQLENSIVEASNKGENPQTLEKDVQKLASLRAQATMVHLRCLYNTRKILTKDQKFIVE